MNAALDGLMLLLQPTNLLALVALGLLAGQGAKGFPLAMMAAFTFGIAVASVLIAAALRAQDTVPAWLLTVAALAGLAVAIARPVPRVVTIVAACLTGAMLALNAPPQAITIPSAITAQIGTALAALAILTFVIVVAWRAARPWQRIALRVLASWIAASAILALALRLAR
jgi:urease accessory protein